MTTIRAETILSSQHDIAFLATQVSQLVPALIEAAKRGVQG